MVWWLQDVKYTNLNILLWTTVKTVSKLNDLLQITNDRIQGFDKVEDKVWDSYGPLKNDYDQMVRESQEMKSDLVRFNSVKRW